MQIVVLEPFYTSSHRQWLDEWAAHSSDEIIKLTLKGKHWKWRMHGGAVTLAQEYLKLKLQPDLIVATDMLDLATFLSLTRKETAHIKTSVYFHENQLVYPWSPTDEDVKLKRDVHYAFINYSSALVADKVLFNSEYHRRSFLEALPSFLNAFPDYQNMESIEQIAQKSEVLPIGMDFEKLEQHRTHERFELPTILWNHRWEYDKNPDDFFNALQQLQKENMAFNLVVLGENYENSPAIFKQVPQLFKKELLHFGFAESRAEYIKWLWKCDIVPVSSKQDFFGISAVEAIYCNNHPILPQRLAFPEHVPEEYLYQSQEELVAQLKAAITSIESIRTYNFSNLVKKYDCNNVISKYSNLIEK